jgi:HAD superfamily hydrolase (TIGR01549 family)
MIDFTFKKPDFIFMDWDNTILDTDPVFLLTFNNLLQRNNILDKAAGPTDAIIMNNKKFLTIFSDYIPNLSEEKTRILVKQYAEIYKEYEHLLNLIPSARDFLIFLKENNIKTALLSNKPNVTIQQEIKKFGLTEYLDLVQGIEEGINEKPDPQLFNIACQKLDINLETDKGGFFGDAHSDVHFAKNCQIPGILLHYGDECTKNNIIKNYAEDIQNKKVIVADRDYNKIIENMKYCFN